MTVCLSMIVRNEAPCLARCLESVRPFIDAWVIVDTGSSDETPMLPRRILHDVPGEVVHRTWKDFATNRNEALELAWEKADYALVIDADDELERVVPDQARPRLELVEIVHLLVQHGTDQHWRPHIVRRGSGHFVGAVHEGFVGKPGASRLNLEGILYKVVGGGARSRDSGRYLKDAAVLIQALERDPDDARSAFYLAQSLRDGGRPAAAREAYGRRAAMGGDPEEVWYSLYQLAELAIVIGEHPGAVIDSYLWAYECRPTRAEPLRAIANYLRKMGRMATAATFDRLADELPIPEGDCLFLERAAYRKAG